MTVTGLAELTLVARDPEALAQFYRQGFGMTELASESDRIWLAAGPAARLGIWTPGKKEFGDQGGRHVHFAFSVRPRSLDAIARRLRERGADVRGPVEHDGGDRSLYVEDPEGNLVEAWDILHRADSGDALATPASDGQSR